MTKLAALAIVLAPTAAGAAALVPGSARIDLAPRSPHALLGENVLIDYCVVNTGRAPFKIDVGGDYRGSSRALRFKVEVRDASGAVQDDPDPNPWNEGGLSYEPEIAPGKKWCESLQLARYARIDAAGTYTIRATHDLGWPAGTAPSGMATITLAMPTPAQADAVIAAMAKLPDDPNASAGETSRAFADFSAMRYDVYSAPLAKLAHAGELRALQGLGEIPTTAATRALVTLLADPSPQVASAAAGALAMRLPDPALGGALGKRNPFENDLPDARKYFIAHAWDPSLADTVRDAARVRLGAASPDEVTSGAFMLESVGTPADGGALVAALDTAIARTRSVPAENGIYPAPRGACMELERAAKILVARGLVPAAVPRSPGELAVWLVALEAGARPRGWEATLDAASRHDLAYVRQLAFEHAPAALPALLVPRVAAGARDADPDVVVSAAELAARAKLAALEPALIAALPRLDGIRLDIVGNDAATLGGTLDRARALADQLKRKAVFQEALTGLIGLLDERGSGGSESELTDAQRAAFAARWRKLIDAHAKEIAAGKKIPLDASGVTPDLLPPGYSVTRSDGTSWPPGSR
ncbi:MAG TPA: hypothetical protein VLX92_28885 [Kofleriaceae bacterium]|nr:hypothetical protein [Kofleriaceae bacterium]